MYSIFTPYNRSFRWQNEVQKYDGWKPVVSIFCNIFENRFKLNTMHIIKKGGYFGSHFGNCLFSGLKLCPRHGPLNKFTIRKNTRTSSNLHYLYLVSIYHPLILVVTYGEQLFSHKLNVFIGELSAFKYQHCLVEHFYQMPSSVKTE